MRTMRYHLTNLLSKFTQPAAKDPYMTDEAIAERQERLRQRQIAMRDEMMANGTHMLMGGNYTRGDSRVLREAGLVK